MSNAKPYCISKHVVYQSYKLVKQNKGSAGVDNLSISDYEKDLRNNLYKLWNRMSSGSYFPSAVKRVDIPKGNGKTRPLGIPTVNDRIAQMVVKLYIEPRLEEIFSENSYGYRPNRSALEAVGQARQNCFKYNFVLDLDIKGFFDNIDHELLMRAVRFHVSEKWVLLYIERWLKSPVQYPDRGEKSNMSGTPQGGVISPLLANLFLHYVMDVWLEKNYPNIPFERYADDAVLHFWNKSYAQKIFKRLEERFKTCKLELNREKSKIVYCKDARRNLDYPNITMSFLGYDFKPRSCRRWHGRIEYVYLPAIGSKAKKRFREQLKTLRISRDTGRNILEIAALLNPIVRGMVNYFGAYYKSELYELFAQIDFKLKKWALRKYKKRGILKCLQQMYRTEKSLFIHWQYRKPTYFFG